MLLMVPALILFICGAFTINQLPADAWTPEKRREVVMCWQIGGGAFVAYLIALAILTAALR